MAVTIDANELKRVFEKMDLLGLNDIDPNEFQGFGMRNSKVYFEKLMKLVAEDNLGRKEFAMLTFLCCILPSKKRLLENIDKLDRLGG